MKYTCKTCGMCVTGLTCCKCNCELEQGHITTESGQTVEVAKCPNGCGMIKSPTCCQQDMQCQMSGK